MKKDLQISELIDIYGVLLTVRQRDTIRSYYDYDLSLAEIAENEGVTRQAVRDTIVKASEQLVDYEASLGILKNKERSKEMLTRAISLIKMGETGESVAVLEALLREIQE